MRLFPMAAPWLWDLMLFAIHTGMRMGEILGLTWAGVDLFRRTVMVFKSKNGERRTIPLNQTALELLKLKYGSRSVETELVFPSEALTRLNASNISRSLHLALKKAKMTDFHFHDLRHTCATRMVQAGGSLQGATITGAQVADHDPAVCPSLSGEFAGWHRSIGCRAGN